MGDVAPLGGTRVIDVSDERGVFAGRILADLGADVIRVEPPGGDRVRRLAPFAGDGPGIDRSLVHLYNNAGKRSVVLDRSAAAGAERWRDLLGTADVLIETDRIDHGEVQSLSPRAVHVTITPFGLDGEWVDGNDLVGAAASGLAWVSGKRGDPPNQPGGNQVYKMAGLAAATGVVIALTGLDRRPDAGSVHLDISLQMAAAMATVQTANPHLLRWQGTVPGRPGLTVVHRCADGRWVTLMVRPDVLDAFLDWCRETGIDPPEDKSELTDPYGGVARLALLAREMAGRFDRADFLKRAWDIGVLGLPVNSIADLETCDHLVETDEFVDVDNSDSGLGAVAFPRSPVDAVGVNIRRAPLLGEHTDAVLSGIRTRSSSSAHEAAGGRRPLDLRTALNGVRVVDFCWVLAGPLGTRILANFGADVLRIEAGARSYPDQFPKGQRHPNVGAFHNLVDTGKRSVTIDPRTSRGRELILELIAKCDIVTNNYRPGAMEEMGFGFDALRDVNPKVISLHLPGCGRRGPWAQLGSFGNMVAAASGLSSLTGFPGGTPRGVGVAYPDFTSPYVLATVALAALRRRDRTGIAQELEVNQLAATISLVGVEWLQYATTGNDVAPCANRDPNWCPHGVYPAAGEDEWIAIAAETDAQWRAVCHVLELDGLFEDRRFLTLADRKSHEDELDALVAERTAQFDKWELARRLQAAAVAAAPVENLRDTMERDPQLRPWYEDVEQPSHPGVEIPICGEVIQVADGYRPLERAPMIGEHTDYALCDVLGLDDTEIDSLRASGVVWSPDER